MNEFMPGSVVSIILTIVSTKMHAQVSNVI